MKKMVLLIYIDFYTLSINQDFHYFTENIFHQFLQYNLLKIFPELKI